MSKNLYIFFTIILKSFKKRKNYQKPKFFLFKRKNKIKKFLFG